MSEALDPEVQFIAERIWAKVWQSNPARWPASVQSAIIALKAVQDYAPIATIGEDLTTGDTP